MTIFVVLISHVADVIAWGVRCHLDLRGVEAVGCAVHKYFGRSVVALFDGSPCFLCVCSFAGLLLSAAARNKHFKLSVGSVGPLILQDIHLKIAQARTASYVPCSYGSSCKLGCLSLYCTRLQQCLSMWQGPIAHIWVSEVSLGHSRSAKKVARAALSWQFRVPFTVRNLTLELRDS